MIPETIKHKTAEEILEKHGCELLDNGCAYVDLPKVIAAMEEYASLAKEELEKEIERLKGLIEKAHKSAYELARYARNIDDEGYYQEQCFAAFKTENKI